MNWIIALVFISLTPLSSSVAIYEQCGGDGYNGPTQCNWPLGCFRRSQWFSSCQIACPGGDWECAGILDTSNGAGLSQPWDQCGGEGWNGPQGCLQYPCQWRSKWYAQCRPDCPADWLCQGSGGGSTVQPVPTTVNATGFVTSGPVDVTTPSLTDNDTDDIFGRYIVTQMLGSDAFDLDMDSFQLPENSDLFNIIVNHIVTIAEAEEPGLMARFGAALQSDNLDERLEALKDMSERIERIAEGSELVTALMQEPLFIELQATALLENVGVNVRAMRIDKGPCNGLTPDIGKVNGLYGSESTSITDIAVGALQLDPRSKTVNAAILAKTELGLGDAPDPDSRLGAYYATRGYESGTVGSAVHRAIGGIYTAMGSVGEEKIGRVFNSEAAERLYNQPIKSAASLCMATIEHLYWTNVKKENPMSLGGNLGSVVTPRTRDSIQRLLSGVLSSSPKSRSLQKAGEVLIIPSGYTKTNYRCMNKPVYCNPKAKNALACIVEDRTSHKGGVWKAGPEKTWGQQGCPTNLRSGTYDANLNLIAS